VISENTGIACILNATKIWQEILGEAILQPNEVIFEKRLCDFNGLGVLKLSELTEQGTLHTEHMELILYTVISLHSQTFFNCQGNEISWCFT
jgi:hypothetical protein